MTIKKLTIELIPSTVWYSSLYKIFKENSRKDLWNNIKKEIFEKEGRKCWVCDENNRRLEAHEFWDYDDIKHIQKLNSVHHLCDLCHKIKHIGLWLHTADGKQKLQKEGLNEFDIINHFCKVNVCNEKEFKVHENVAFDLWNARSKHNWKQDFGCYDKIISKLNISRQS